MFRSNIDFGYASRGGMTALFGVETGWQARLIGTVYVFRSSEYCIVYTPMQNALFFIVFTPVEQIPYEATRVLRPILHVSTRRVPDCIRNYAGESLRGRNTRPLIELAA